MPSKTPHQRRSSRTDNKDKDEPTSPRKRAPAKKGAKDAKDSKDKDGKEVPKPITKTVVVVPSKKAAMAAAAGKTGPGAGGAAVPDDEAAAVDGADGDGDVEMADGSGEAKDGSEKTLQDIKAATDLIERAVAHFDARFTLRALRAISSLRKRLTPTILHQAVTEILAGDDKAKTATAAEPLLAALGDGDDDMQIDGDSDALNNTPADATTTTATATNSSPDPDTRSSDPSPEIELYLALLVMVHLYDSSAFARGAAVARHAVARLRLQNRRSLDSLAAKAYLYLTLFSERLGPLPPSPRSPLVTSVRPILLAALRSAVLRKDTEVHAASAVLLLRCYLATANVRQADLLVAHCAFPAETAANNQVARFLYYLGRLRALQLRYTEAHEHLTSATRKAPAASAAARGFVVTATKLLLVVELLMGDIPDRATFAVPAHAEALQPYLRLVQAVRVGQLDNFEATIAAHAATFRRDGTLSLIVRLRQNVIKTGLRLMSLSYSRISLRDICIRLRLGSEESAEYMVAKAIRDGVIEARLDRERGFMASTDAGDVYAGREPTEAFHDRIRACLALHDESVKAMRFPMNQHRLELKNAQEAREREREMAKEIQDGELDEDDLGADFDGI